MQLAMPNVTFGIGFQMPARHQPKTLPNFVPETYHKEKKQLAHYKPATGNTNLQLAMPNVTFCIAFQTPVPPVQTKHHLI
jgi:hypothetical protein